MTDYKCALQTARANAYRLMENDGIKHRVAELLEKRRLIDAKALARGVSFISCGGIAWLCILK